MTFEMPKNDSSIIKVIGVGGGGSNAVNHMYRMGVKGVEFIVCNTDRQALDISPVPFKMTLGVNLTKGLGAGSRPEVGRNAAMESIDEIKRILSDNTEMIFITAGMGGGTGTGAAPVIAQIAREMGILTVGIVTLPFVQEGKKRKDQATNGIDEMRKYVDSLLIINNDKLREIYGNLKASQSFAKADDVLATAARGIADIITTTLQINTDINDVKTVMKDSGVAIMGSASASGEGRAIKAVQEAINSPLLNDSNIKGARYVLLNITCGSGDNEITMDELGEITDFVQEAAGQTAELIKGYGIDETLGDRVNVTMIATGFNSADDTGLEVVAEKPKKIVHHLTNDSFGVVAENKPVSSIENSVVEPVVEAKVEFVVPVVNTINNPVVDDIQTETLSQANITEVPVDVVEVQENVLGSAIDDIEIESNEELVETFNSIDPTISDDYNKNEPYLIVKDEPVQQTTIEFEIVNPIETTMENSQPEVVSEQNIFEQPISQVEEVNTPVAEISKPTLEWNESAIVSESVTNVSSENDEIRFVSETTVNTTVEAKVVDQNPYNEEQLKKAQDRIARLKEMSYKVKTPTGIYEMENEPAYKRKNVRLDEVIPAAQSQVSRFTLSEGENNKVEIKPNNSFLHDNVD